MGPKNPAFKRLTPLTTQSDSTKLLSPNLLHQQLWTTAPNQKWVADITYLPTAPGWVNLAVALDLISRKGVGWDFPKSSAAPLASIAVRQAIETRRPRRGNFAPQRPWPPVRE